MKRKLSVLLICAFLISAAMITSSIALAKDTDESAEPRANSSETKNEAHVSVRFSSAKRLVNDLDEVKNQVNAEREEEVGRIISEKYGFDAGSDDLSEKQQIDMMYEYGNYDNEKLTEIFKKIADDGYGTEDLIFEDEDFRSEENIERYCDLIKMTCNAYNDPDYDLSDYERVRILGFIENSVLTLNTYIYQHKDNTPDCVYETRDYESNTFLTECGYRPLEG